MNVTIRKGAKAPQESIEKAMAWIHRKYPTVNFTGVDIAFGKGCRCRYFRNADRPKYGRPYVFIATNIYDVSLYDMKTLGLKRTTVYTGAEVYIETGIVHELTHHVQYETGMPTGELLTTKNELEYLRDHYPDIHAKFYAEKAKPKKR
jgi:hypothetical protein